MTELDKEVIVFNALEQLALTPECLEKEKISQYDNRFDQTVRTQKYSIHSGIFIVAFTASVNLNTFEVEDESCTIVTESGEEFDFNLESSAMETSDYFDYDFNY